MADGAWREEVGAQRPLCFLHIGKTGGTSFSDAVGRLYPDDRRFSNGGNITVDYLDRLDGALSGPSFIAGHAAPGVVSRLRGKADMITLLRRPNHQAVSNYLHILTEPDNPLYGSASRQSFSDYLRENPHQIAYQAVSLAVALSTPEAPIDPLHRNSLDPLLDFLESLTFVGVIERPEDCCERLSALLSIDPPLRLPCLNSALYRGVSPRTVKQLGREYRALMTDPELGYLFALEALVYAKAEALLTRSVADRARGARPARGRAVAGPVGAGRFASPEGSLDGGRYVCALADATGHLIPGHLIYGPFERLERGGHAAEFQFTLEGVAPNGRGRVEIEVLANGAHSLAKRWLQPAGSATAPQRTLCFLNRSASNVLEFRVRAKGFEAGRLVFLGVNVRPAALHRTWPSLIGAAVRRAARGIGRVMAVRGTARVA